jgi:hypothetical protein
MESLSLYLAHGSEAAKLRACAGAPDDRRAAVAALGASIE